MQTIPILVAVLPLAGVLIGAGLQYVFGRTLEARKHLTAQKGLAYADYFKALAVASTQGRSKEMLSLATDAKTRVCIYGSTKVVRQMAIFEGTGAKVTGDGEAAIAELIKMMRTDMGVGGARVKERDLHKILFAPPGR